MFFLQHFLGQILMITTTAASVTLLYEFSYGCGKMFNNGDRACVCHYTDGGRQIVVDCRGRPSLMDSPWEDFTEIEQSRVVKIVMTGTAFCARTAPRVIDHDVDVECAVDAGALTMQHSQLTPTSVLSPAGLTRDSEALDVAGVVGGMLALAIVVATCATFVKCLRRVCIPRSL